MCGRCGDGLEGEEEEEEMIIPAISLLGARTETRLEDFSSLIITTLTLSVSFKLTYVQVEQYFLVIPACWVSFTFCIVLFTTRASIGLRAIWE